MIYFYYGEDSYRAKETIRELKKKFISLYDPAGHNTAIIDESEFTLEGFFNAVKASGFLAPKKFIIIKNFFSVKNFADVQDSVIDFLKTLKNTKDENYLIFWHEGLPRSNTKLFKYLTKLCTPLNCCKNFEKLDTPRLVAWIQHEAALKGKKISKEAAELLRSLVGDSTWHLHHEIAKLCNATADQTITVTNMQELVTAMRSDTIFPLVDALGAKKKAEALKLIEEYLQQKNDKQFLLSMIIRQYRLILQTKEASNQTNNSFAIAQRLSMHPFVAKKMLVFSGNYTKKELERIYGTLVALDGIFKSDPAYLGAALTLFVTAL